MKSLVALFLILCLFACKEKEATPSGPPAGLIGTYEVSSIKPSYVFQDLLADYDNFKETTSVTITPVGNTYRLQVQTIGVARKGIAPLNYGFTADMSCQSMVGYAANFAYSCRGKYSNLTPTTPELDRNSKEIEGWIYLSGLNLEVNAKIPYGEDAYPIVAATLLKIK